MTSDLLSSRVWLGRGGSFVNILREDPGEGQKSTEKLNRKQARGIEVSSHEQREENGDQTGNQEKGFVETAWKGRAGTLTSRHSLIQT